MGDTKAAGDGLSDEEMVKQVNDQTDSELVQKDYFERESDGTVSDTEAAKADADEASGD
jgi:protease I